MSSLIDLIFSKETLFALSLFPYLGFLWFMTKKIPTPKVALIGFYLTLLFVAVTIPIGAYAQLTLHKSLADVDILHGGAEFFLTLSNITIAIGFSQALKSTKPQSQPSKD
jgi:heme A synthase